MSDNTARSRPRRMAASSCVFAGGAWARVRGAQSGSVGGGPPRAGEMGRHEPCRLLRVALLPVGGKSERARPISCTGTSRLARTGPMRPFSTGPRLLRRLQPRRRLVIYSGLGALSVLGGHHRAGPHTAAREEEGCGANPRRKSLRVWLEDGWRRRRQPALRPLVAT